MTEVSEKLPVVTGYRLLLKPHIPAESKSAGGIVLTPDTQKANGFLTMLHQVVAMGDSAYQDKGLFPNGPWCDVGDFVLINRHSGIRVPVRLNESDKDAQDFKIANDQDVLARVADPATIQGYAD